MTSKPPGKQTQSRSAGHRSRRARGLLRFTTATYQRPRSGLLCLMLLATLTSYIVPLCSWLSGQGPPATHHHDATTATSIPTSLSPPSSSRLEQQQLQQSGKLKFELKQLHAVSNGAQVIFHDVKGDDYRARGSGGQDSQGGGFGAGDDSPWEGYSIATRPMNIYRPPPFEQHAAARTRSMRFGQSTMLEWGEDEILAPDVERREVLLLLAKMANDAYVEPGDPYWYDLGGGWNNTYPFGWEPDADGFRGQVFATEDNSTVVVSIKGTSAGLFGGGGPTAKKDKLNDNLLFSCCCARVDWSWTTVCGCYRGGWKCHNDCVEEALVEDSLFYPIGTNLYNNLTYMYPTSNIWFIGHSLGGALASLLGATFGNPVVTFESPGERLASTRLHLPQPSSLHHITHVYHTADPIAMGTCNGVLSSCALGGYALETGCHLGRTIVYDTVTHLGWSVDVRTHGIVPMIEKILAEPWQPSVDEGREVPLPAEQVDCVECYSWEFGDFPEPTKPPKKLT
ncbi:lipase [Ephemerocybe angulata]|uniref:triacylglycerol lipase n=1 Tax=Ephemerocybe angulata TaxID=980116 RepID=A0A8H6HX07_9AGAR|nr:lipase [Tulosesus angulatus]